MKWFVSRRVPEPTRVLLVESGPRQIAEEAIPRIRRAFGNDLPIDLLTCLPDAPGNLRLSFDAEDCEVWRVTDCTDNSSRWRLLHDIRSRRHPITALVCAGVPIMASWRMAALLLFRSKILIINENADFFWLDRGHWRNLSQFWLHRAGLLDESAVRTVSRILSFPFVFTYLLAYAGGVGLMRLGRMALGLQRRP